MNLLDKSTPTATAASRSLTVADSGDIGVCLSELVGVLADGKHYHVSREFWIRPDDLVEVHAALGRAIDARLHAEASKSVNPK